MKYTNSHRRKNQYKNTSIDSPYSRKRVVLMMKKHTIYSRKDYPLMSFETSYETLKNWVNQYARNQEIRRGILGALSESVTSRDRCTYTGITYGGRGQAMEIDADRKS